MVKITNNNKDWIGTSKFISSCNNRNKSVAENNDYYAIEPKAIVYAWFIWVKGFKGNPVIKWVN